MVKAIPRRFMTEKNTFYYKKKENNNIIAPCEIFDPTDDGY